MMPLHGRIMDEGEFRRVVGEALRFYGMDGCGSTLWTMRDFVAGQITATNAAAPSMALVQAEEFIRRLVDYMWNEAERGDIGG